MTDKVFLAELDTKPRVLFNLRIAKGTVFTHRRFINEDGTPARFHITRVARGWFWYAHEGQAKAHLKSPVADAATVVLEVLG